MLQLPQNWHYWKQLACNSTWQNVAINITDTTSLTHRTYRQIMSVTDTIQIQDEWLPKVANDVLNSSICYFIVYPNNRLYNCRTHLCHVTYGMQLTHWLVVTFGAVKRCPSRCPSARYSLQCTKSNSRMINGHCTTCRIALGRWHTQQ